tara:strand:- start:2015 stop:2353 length:339 start_codon:yes stop_codon:yes gene_type:complete
MKQLSFEQLPNAVHRLYTKLESIERLLIQSSTQAKEEPNKLLTIDEASVYLNLAKPTIYSMVSKNTIPFMKKSKRLYFSKDELHNYVSKGRVKTIIEIQKDAISNLSNQKRA